MKTDTQNQSRYHYRIERDKWGVPHIWGKTDADAVYGFARARADDQFDSLQEALMTIRGRSAEVHGPAGIGNDVLIFLVFAGCPLTVSWEKELSPEFKKILEAGKDGFNDYARANAGRVKYRGLFPISETDILKSYILIQAFTSGAIYALGKVAGNKMENLPSGSNSFCFSGAVMEDGLPTLISNVHQPIDGAWTFYEAHLVSDEGWNILGAVYAPVITPLLGVTPNHGWTLTNNYADFTDTFELETHPDNPMQYRIDSRYESLEALQFKTRVRLGPFKIPFKRHFYASKFGVAIRNKSGLYAVNFSARYATKAAEQLYRMGKAKNLGEFKQALNLQGLSCQNILYLDRHDNQFLISAGLFPFREASFFGPGIKAGTTDRAIWPPIFHPLTALPQLENPRCGILYNANNPPFFATQPDENLNPHDTNRGFGFILKESNRGLRMREFLAETKGRKLSLDEVLRMKYDRQFAQGTFYSFFLENTDQLLQQCASKYPDLEPGLAVIRKWNRQSSKDNRQASFFAVLCCFLVAYLDKNFRMGQCNQLSEPVFTACFRKAQKHLIRHFGTLEIPLGEVQFLVRGNKELPIGGLPENIAASFSVRHRGGKLKVHLGDSYIMVARFSTSGVLVESVVPYGSSENPDSVHYSDQMELFANEKRKEMDLYFFDHQNQPV